MLYDTTNVGPDKSCLKCSNYKLDFCIEPTQSKAHKLLHTCTNTQHTYTRAHTHTHTHTPTHMHTHTERDDTYNMYVHMYTCTVHITTGAYACAVTHLHMVIGRMYSHSLPTILLWACSLAMYMRQEAHKWSRKDVLSVSLSAITDIS